MNDNRLAKIEIRKLQRKMTANLQTLEKKVNDYFVTSQNNRAFSVDDVASILNAEISRMEIAEQRLAKELYHMKKRVISYPRAIEMAKKCGVSRQAIFMFESRKTVSYKLLLQYISILYTPEEAANIIEKWGQ